MESNLLLSPLHAQEVAADVMDLTADDDDGTLGHVPLRATEWSMRFSCCVSVAELEICHVWKFPFLMTSRSIEPQEELGYCK